MPQITTFLIQNGIPELVLAWLFMLPIIISLTVVGRQIIGIKGFGISAPILIGFAFFATGLPAGIIIFLTMLAAGYITKYALSKVRLLYLPKLTLILFGIILAVSALAPFLPYREAIHFPQAAFSFIILIFSAEQFSSILMERGSRKMVAVALETLIMSVAIFYLLTWSWFQNVALTYPLFIMAAAIVINLSLGKWTGLRVSEYIRFKDIIFR